MHTKSSIKKEMSLSHEKTEKEQFITVWTKEPFPKEVRLEAEMALKKFTGGKSDPETESFTTPLEFGTGGIRGVIGNGIGRMNDYTVGRAALGLCNYLASKYKNPLIAIAYDSRRKSKEFAEVTAMIAAEKGIKVKIFKNVAPTPLLSYAVRYFKAQGGVVITASHNPPEYNGFKAYLEDGGQLVSPADKQIIDLINKITDWNEIKLIGKNHALYKKNVSFVENNCFASYLKNVGKSGIISAALTKKDRGEMKIVYTPLHGTGGEYMKKTLNHFGYKKVFLVPEQAKPDGEFPTVKYPNPEEPAALVLAEKHAHNLGAHAFIATDPDADRLGIGVLKNGKYILLNGNQIGSIMAAYLCEKKATENGAGKNYYLLKTIVTTRLQEEIARKNKIKFKNVLTGFKFIAEEMGKLDGKKDIFLFGGEESFGYLPVNFVRDKDSLSSALLLLEILTEKKDLITYLNEIYLEYGLFLESLESLTLKGESGKQKINDALNKLRQMDIQGKKIGNRKILSLLDYKEKIVKTGNKQGILKGFPASNVIQLELEGAILTVRPSGTEPKVKFYFSYKSLEKTVITNLEKDKKNLTKEIKAATSELLKMTGLK